MWGWVKYLLDWLESFIRKEVAKPRTIEDAKTPENIRTGWSAYLRDKLRDKDSRN